MPSDRSINGYRLTMTRCSRCDRGVAGFVGIPQGLSLISFNVAYSEGGNCVACHTLQSYKGIQGEDGKMRLGLKAYEVSDKLQGPAAFPRGVQQLTAAGDDLFGGAVDEAADSQKPNPHLGKPVEMEGIRIPALTMKASPFLMKTSDACMGCHDQRNNAQDVPLCATGNDPR